MKRIALLLMVALAAMAFAEKLPPLPAGVFTYVVIPDTQLYRGEGAHVKTKEVLDWAELKKNVVFMGENVVNGDGEIIPGITITERPDKFVVEVK